MANYITTLKDESKTNDLSPRTVLKALADDSGSYLNNGLLASDLNALKDGEINKLEGNFAPIEVSPSLHAYSVGSMLVYNGILYKVTSAISVGSTLTVGTNISSQSVSNAISDIIASVDGIFIPITPVQGSNNYQANYIRLYTRNNKKMADISIGIKNASTGDIKATYNSSLFPYSVVIGGAGVLSNWEPIVIYINGGNVTVLGSKSDTTYVCCGATVVLDS